MSKITHFQAREDFSKSSRQFSNEQGNEGESHSGQSFSPPTQFAGGPPDEENGLPMQLRSNMEAMSGFDLSDVQVHHNSNKPAQLQAHAFAQGNQIHLGPGQEQHLPHEAWHVVQQKQGRVQPTQEVDRFQVNDDPSLENEADQMGAKALQMKETFSPPPSDSAAPNTGTSQLKAFSPSNSPIQLAKLNLRKDQTISGISDFPSRPTSNMSSKQGQHLTAYVVFETMMLTRLRDKTVSQAASELVKILDEIIALPGCQSNYAKWIVTGAGQYKQYLQQNNLSAKDVGGMIDHILSLRNKVPGTTQNGTGGGHGESSPAGTLELVQEALRKKNWNNQWDPKVVSNQCREAVWQLLDFNPNEPQKDSDVNNIVKVIVTHYKSIISGFPDLDIWLCNRNEFFADYLLNNRNGKNMPMQKLKQNTLTDIFKLVQKEM